MTDTVTREEIYLSAEFREFLIRKFGSTTGKFDTKEFFKNLLEYMISYAGRNEKKMIRQKLTDLIDRYQKYLNDIKRKQFVAEALRKNFGITDRQVTPIDTQHLQFLSFVFVKERSRMTDNKFVPLKNILRRKSRDKISVVETYLSRNTLSYEQIINEALDPELKTHRYEDLLIQLISELAKPDTRDFTIVVEDVSFVFKIAPTIINMLGRKNARICLLFSPKSGKDLLYNHELLLLYQLGIYIEVLPILEHFDYQGFYLGYYAPDETAISSSMIFFHLKNNIFERSTLVERITTASDRAEFTKAVNSLQNKRSRRQISPLTAFKPKVLSYEEYGKWLLSRFNYCKDFTEHLPAYSTILASGNDIKFEVRKVSVSEIYHRIRSITAYKVYQAEKVMLNNPLFSKVIGDTISFHPLNLFENGPERKFYTVNVPILEENVYKGRYEVAEGTSRIYAALKKFGIRWVETIVVLDLPQTAFRFKDGLIVGANNFVSNDWSSIPIDQNHPNKNKISILEMDRHFETSATHPFGNTAYTGLGKELVKQDILTQEEAVRFSNRKYKPILGG